MNAPASSPILEGCGLGKRFGASTALADVNLALYPGEVHGLVGCNGAGKSTLSKILSGALPDHDGRILIDGRELRFVNPLAAREHGVAMVYQELSGVGPLSIAENLFLGRQPTGAMGRIDWSTMRRRAEDYLGEMRINVDVRRRLDRCPLVIRQMVEIARGLHSGARVLILDEPTSALSPPETRRLFDLLVELRARGVAILFISHFLEDVLEISQRVTVLKDGKLVATLPTSGLDKHQIVHAMLGHSQAGEEIGYEAAAKLPSTSNEPIVLHAKALSLKGAFNSLDLTVRAGECVGVYGFVGAGHSELAHVLAGAQAPSGGVVEVHGDRLPSGRPDQAIRRGVVLVAADRAKTLVRGAPIYRNVTLAHLRGCVGNWLTRRREFAVSKPILAQVGCRPPEPRLSAGNLSGGNQQKIVLGKWLLGMIRVLVLEEPTRGMDVGAKEEVMGLVRRQKESGAAVLLASSEPELLLAHCDRILVMSRGRISHEFVGGTVDRKELLRHA